MPSSLSAWRRCLSQLFFFANVIASTIRNPTWRHFSYPFNPHPADLRGGDGHQTWYDGQDQVRVLRGDLSDLQNTKTLTRPKGARWQVSVAKRPRVRRRVIKPARISFVHAPGRCASAAIATSVGLIHERPWSGSFEMHDVFAPIGTPQLPQSQLVLVLNRHHCTPRLRVGS